jgi:hypothetical protein
MVAKKVARRRRVVPLGAALTLILFSYPCAATAIAVLLSESRTRGDLLFAIAPLGLGVALLAAGTAALPAASRFLRPAALLLTFVAAAALCAAVVAFWMSSGDDRVGAGAFGVFAAASLVGALLLVRVARVK